MDKFISLIRQVFPSIYFTALGVEQIVDELIEAFGLMVDRVIDGFFRLPPSPAIIADAIIRFCTQVPGILASVIFYGIKNFVLDKAKEAGVGHRVIRVDRAIEGFFDAQIEWFQTLSGTNEVGLWEAIAQYGGRMLWALFKRSKLILTLLRVKSEQELIAAILRSLRGGARLTFILIIIRAAVAIIAWIACLLAMVGLMFHVGQVGKFVLGQDAPRKRVRIRGGGSIRRRAPGGVPP